MKPTPPGSPPRPQKRSAAPAPPPRQDAAKAKQMALAKALRRGVKKKPMAPMPDNDVDGM